MLRFTAATWGVLGVVVFLAYAVLSLLEHAIAAFEQSMSVLHWAVLVVNVVFMAYVEGYKGFQKGFSPRVAARVLYLRDHASLIQGILAPLFCLGYFGTTRRRQVSVIALTLLLLILVTAVGGLDQPWRGIIDAGVVVGLSWGLLSFIIFVVIAFTQKEFPYSAEVTSQR